MTGRRLSRTAGKNASDVAHRVAMSSLLCVATIAAPAAGQTGYILENFEFASSDAAAAAGVIDLTDPPNRPALYISGQDENASPQEPGGLYSIGTSAVFCIDFDWPCEPGTFIGFRRHVDGTRFPSVCAGGEPYAPLKYTYGDPGQPGAETADFPLSELALIWDVYGDGGFADGLTGTHLWLRVYDCEGELYEFVNYSEVSLYSELWTLDVRQGDGLMRLSPQSLVDVPDGDRLLTEIAGIEALIQDEDDPPTAVGNWYVDYLRLLEPPAAQPGDADGDGDVDLDDFAGFAACLLGPGTALGGGCEVFDGEADGDVDLSDFRYFQEWFGAGAFQGRKSRARPAGNE